jgi:23S rRNA pseudouridine2605 synthase
LKKERLQKILSRQEYGSRRTCEKLIIDKRIRLNGEIAKLGDKGNLHKDKIEIDGFPIRKSNISKIYIAFNKPSKVLSEFKKQDDRKNICDYIDLETFLFVVGRLDYFSEGLMLLTNNGDLTHKLTHPRYEHEKEYEVLLGKNPEIAELERWRKGIILKNGYKTQPAVVSVIQSSKTTAWIQVILKEGKKRQIREVGEILNLPVKRIIRKRISTLELGNLGEGSWRYLLDHEINDLKKAIQ